MASNRPVTRFCDMHSGGENKIKPYKFIFIEAPLKKAIAIFKREFDRDPDHITCDCCGPDFSAEEYENLETATAYDRGCNWVSDEKGYDQKTGTPLKEFLQCKEILFIPKKIPKKVRDILDRGLELP